MSKPIFCGLAMTLIACISVAQVSDLNFRRFTKREGLSSNHVTSFAQTPDGYLWIGTTDGLNRFDGYEFHIFKNDPRDSTSISDNHITSLYVDQQGTLWIGTENSGLMRYLRDSQAFEKYRPSFYDQNALSHEFVTSITEDANRNLWVGTILGLNLYQRASNDFKRYFFEASYLLESRSLQKLKNQGVDHEVVETVREIMDSVFHNESQLIKALQALLTPDQVQQYGDQILRSANVKRNAEHIRVLEPDNMGNLWIGYESNGLSYFNPNTNYLKSYHHVLDKINKSSQEVGDLLVDQEALWIGFKDGSFYQIKGEQIAEVQLSGTPGCIQTIYKDHQENIWVGDNSGLYRKKKNETHFQKHVIDPTNEWGVATHDVSAIFEDNQQNTWIGIVQGGVNQILQDIPFTTYSSRPSSPVQLTKNSVSKIHYDSHGNLWVGYYTSGVDLVKRGSSQAMHFEYDPEDPYSLGKGTVFSIFEDSKGRLWFGTYEGGLQRFRPETNDFETYRHHPQDARTISGNDIRGIAEDESGNLWLAVHGGGINQFNPETRKATRYYADYLNWEHSLSDNWVYDLAFDDDGELWIASVAGITIFSPQKHSFRSYGKRNSLISHDKVRVLTPAAPGTMWVGTESGLNLFDQASESFQVLTVADGLLENVITGIQYDHNDGLWVASKSGLTRLDAKTLEINTFRESDAFEGNEFFPGAMTSGGGQVFVGGSHGLLTFDPDDLTVDSIAIPLILTDVKINNNTQNLLSGAALSHHQNSITFEYTGINFEKANRLKYAYKLEGFDEQWFEVGNKRQAAYTNLPAGSYTFMLKASVENFDWHPPQPMITFTIKPPFWLTYTAYAIYVMLGVIGLLAYRKILIRRERKRIQHLWEANQTRLSAELDALKVKFYSEVAGALKGPFDMIRNPLRKLINENENISPNARLTYYKLISRNTRKLHRMIDQLNDISGFGSDSASLVISAYDMVQYCRSLTDAFIYQADKRHLDFSFQCNIGKAEVHFDLIKLEKIFYSLLTHLFKQSSPGDEVLVSLEIYESNAREVPDKLMSRSLSRNARISISHQASGLQRRNWNDESNSDQNFVTAFVEQVVTSHWGDFSYKETQTNRQYTIWIPVDQLVYEHCQVSPVLDLKEQLKDFESCVNSELEEEHFFVDRSGEGMEPDNAFVKQLNEVIEKHLSNDAFGPDELAEHMNLSRSQLYKKVRHELNLSVSILIRNKRLGKALELLGESELSISEVAYSVGFSDPGYFTKCFREIYGKSPTEFMQST